MQKELILDLEVTINELKVTNADLKISLYVPVNIKILS